LQAISKHPFPFNITFSIFPSPDLLPENLVEPQIKKKEKTTEDLRAKMRNKTPQKRYS